MEDVSNTTANIQFLGVPGPINQALGGIEPLICYHRKNSMMKF